MCVGCFSNAEALIITGSGAVGAAKVGLTRIAMRVTRRSPGARRLRSYDETATFLAGLGHDPALLLGPRPADPEAMTKTAEPAGPGHGRSGTDMDDVTENAEAETAAADVVRV